MHTFIYIDIHINSVTYIGIHRHTYAYIHILPKIHRQLGIISQNFPQVAEFDNLEQVVPSNELVQVKHNGSDGVGIHNPSNSLGTTARPMARRGECGCPIRKLSP